MINTIFDARMFIRPHQTRYRFHTSQYAPRMTEFPRTPCFFPSFPGEVLCFALSSLMVRIALSALIALTAMIALIAHIALIALAALVI